MSTVPNEEVGPGPQKIRHERLTPDLNGGVLIENRKDIQESSWRGLLTKFIYQRLEKAAEELSLGGTWL